MNDKLIVHYSQERESSHMPREIHRSNHMPSDVGSSTIHTINESRFIESDRPNEKMKELQR